MPSIAEIIRKFKGYECMECGKCTALCPVTRMGSTYGPRRAVRDLMDEGSAPLASCRTCGACETRCPMGVEYTALVKAVRAEGTGGTDGEAIPGCAHSGIFQSLAEMMAEADFPQDRLTWVTDDMKVAEKGEVLYFVGCAPYFDAYFQDHRSGALEGVKNGIRLLNALGIEPVLMADERCCGHDQLWSGDKETFLALAKRNVEQIKATGAKTVVTGCAECARALRLDYAEHLGNPGFKVKHMAELLAEKLPEAGLEMQEQEVTVTFQDPCRLGRHMGVFDAPRDVMAALPGLKLSEMPRSGRDAVCCGTSCWRGCDAISKAAQVSRLESAQGTGAQVLVTACPKCKIHFRCAQHECDGEPAVQIEDLATVVTRYLEARDEALQETTTTGGSTNV